MSTFAILVVTACLSTDPNAHCEEYSDGVWSSPNAQQQCRDYEDHVFKPDDYQEPVIYTRCEA